MYDMRSKQYYYFATRWGCTLSTVGAYVVLVAASWYLNWLQTNVAIVDLGKLLCSLVGVPSFRARRLLVCYVTTSATCFDLMWSSSDFCFTAQLLYFIVLKDADMFCLRSIFHISCYSVNTQSVLRIFNSLDILYLVLIILLYLQLL
jgi:hypothetical protein